MANLDWKHWGIQSLAIPDNVQSKYKALPTALSQSSHNAKQQTTNPRRGMLQLSSPFGAGVQRSIPNDKQESNEAS